MSKMKKKIYITILIFGIINLFFISYYITSNNIKNRNLDNQNIENSKETSATTISRALKENLKVSFYTGRNRDKVTTVSELLKEMNVGEYLTEEILTNAVSKDGYKLVDKSDEMFIYKRDEKAKLKANTYYIGESDGYLAIYKTDDKGSIKDKKVYSEDIPIDMLRDIDIDKLKNYEYFNSSSFEEAENKITELTT
ncbi:hypothetical protein [Clostridium sp.]|uniref:hypothetical protein n=1 Tax=Clostridium sp. TaxID=1506 RepID=UPI002A90FFD2|nr:hypothetical protein [Clostridium sp.]MDY6011585.1 hypothetical protein [Clostridium sp.]